ncbi:MAG: aldolase/citrate lyase family protein [Candidatus Brocadiia bacterium]|jgi:4-hydroxy-2-oxoheptanedioate aldolase|nr:aldolase/citrate lyase family protein [Candidatus Brocadiia bacterium]
MPNALKEKLDRDEVVVGAAVVHPIPSAIENMGDGWDWVWVDRQHGQHGYRTMLECIRVADSLGVPPIVRTPGHEYGLLGPIMDARPAGILIPMVETPEQARALVEATRFPPLGHRSIGSRRAIAIQGRDYACSANEDLLLIVQIETDVGVANAEAIAATEGVNGMMMGSVDLKLSMDIPLSTPNQECEELQKAKEAVVRAARNAGKFAGDIAAGPVELVEQAVEMGFRMLLTCSDTSLLMPAAQKRFQELRAAL